MKARRALITGITGQDGSYLAELLVQQGYTVIGVTSGASDRSNLRAIADRITWETGDIGKEPFVRSVLEKHAPDEVYNLASVATVAEPWSRVPDIAHVTALAPLYFLENIKALSPHTRFFQASSAEMFGEPLESPQNEGTPLHPRNPYGIAKVFAHTMVGAYRRDQGLFAASGILFNHESPRRGEQFVTRKITRSLVRIKRGMETGFSLGNLDARRDWGFAGDYVQAMQLMIRSEHPDDYVIATGIDHTIREFVEAACRELDMPLEWKGKGKSEVGITGGNMIITIDERVYRPAEQMPSCGDAAKIRRELGWKPEHTFKDLVSMMVKSDYAAV